MFCRCSFVSLTHPSVFTMGTDPPCSFCAREWGDYQRKNHKSLKLTTEGILTIHMKISTQDRPNLT